MATERRLIDANALSEKIGNMKFEITHNRGGYRYCNEDEKSEWDKLDGFDSLVCDAPTVDAVEVVRSKDCEFWGGVTFGNVCRRWSAPLAGMKNCTTPDDFCSYGERKMVNLEDIVDLDAQTKANNEAMRKVIAFMAGERRTNERKVD